VGGETDTAVGIVLVAGLLDGGTVALACCLVLLRVCTMAMILSMTLDFLYDTMASPSVLPSGSFSTVAGLPSHIRTSATTTSLAFPSSDSIFTSAGCTALGHPRSTLLSSSSIFSTSAVSSAFPCQLLSSKPVDAGYAHRDNASPTMLSLPAMCTTSMLKRLSLACQRALLPTGPSPATCSLYHDSRLL
jgi:hypothetical protein